MSEAANKGVVQRAESDPVCLAALLHHEARGESWKGKRAVLDNVLYRMHKYRQSCVTVATAYKQYSGFRRQQIYTVTNKQLTDYWRIARLGAVCRDCEYFHRKELHMVWTKHLTRVATIGGHTFWKEKV